MMVAHSLNTCNRLYTLTPPPSFVGNPLAEGALQRVLTFAKNMTTPRGVRAVSPCVSILRRQAPREGYK